MFNFDPVFTKRQCTKLKKTFLVRVLFPALICPLVHQLHTNVNDDAASGILNLATNDTGCSLRERNRRHCKMRKRQAETTRNEDENKYSRRPRLTRDCRPHFFQKHGSSRFAWRMLRLGIFIGEFSHK